jgi:hypothetical protein
MQVGDSAGGNLVMGVCLRALLVDEQATEAADRYVVVVVVVVAIVAVVAGGVGVGVGVGVFVMCVGVDVGFVLL